MNGMIRWGILGCAKIATKSVIPAIQSSQFGRVSAIASRTLRKAQDVASEFDIPNAYGSYDELLADPEIDAIYNPLPNQLHLPWTLKAIESGKPVLCEKPIALNADDAMKLASAQAATGIPVVEAFMVRHHPQWTGTRDLIVLDRIGDAKVIQTIFSYYLDDPKNVRNQAETGGGGLYDVGCYAINTARYLFDAEPLRAIALMEIDPVFGTDRLTSGLIEFPGGRHLVFTCATQLSLTQKVTIIGTRGRIEIPIPFNAPRDIATSIIVDDGRDLSGTGRLEIALDPIDQYREQADAFARLVLSGDPHSDAILDAVANMTALDALLRSTASGRWETP